MTVLKVDLKEGVSQKSNRPYSFYVASIVDEDANVFRCNVSDALVEKVGKEKILKVKNTLATVDGEITPKGFDAGIELTDWVL